MRSNYIFTLFIHALFLNCIYSYRIHDFKHVLPNLSRNCKYFKQPHSITFTDFSLRATASFNSAPTKVNVLKKRPTEYHSNKFNRMVERFSNYDETDILSLKNERLIHLIHGGQESLNDINVVTAFRILYEDLMPVRIGGDVLFNILESSIQKARGSRENISDYDISRGQSIRSAALEDIPVISGKEKYRNRYMHMVTSFSCWSDRLLKNTDIYSNANRMESTKLVDANSDRIGMVLNGCLAGAKNSGVVKALGILYEDYLPIRMAGDVIFKLVEKKFAEII